MSSPEQSQNANPLSERSNTSEGLLHHDTTIEIEGRLMEELLPEMQGEWPEAHGEDFREYFNKHGGRLIEEYKTNLEAVLDELKQEVIEKNEKKSE